MTCNKENTTLTLTFGEDLTAAALKDVSSLKEPLNDCSCVGMDFTGVTDIDARGVDFLLYIHCYAKKNNKTHFIENASPEMKRILEIFGLDKLLPIL